MHDETDRDEIIVVMIEKRAAAGLVAQGPAEGMLDQALLMLGGIDLPDFLQADAEFARLALGIERKFRNELLGQAATCAFGKQRILAAQLHAAGERSLVRAVLGDAHVAGRNAPHRALVIVEHLDRGKTRIDFDTKRLGLARQPATKLPKRANVAVMIVHQRRHHEIRQADRAGFRHPVEAIILDLCLQRTIGIFAPIRNELVERDGIHHSAGQNMRADFRTLLDHNNRKFGVELLQPDRRAKSRRPGADDHDIELHGFTRRQFFVAHGLISGFVKIVWMDVCFRFSREGQPWKWR